MLENNVETLAERVEQLESELQRSELAGQVKSSYLESLSHDIRTSINGIVGMTDLVLETELDEKQHSYLEMVSSSVDRLLEVVNEVLDFSKIETGQVELESEEFNLKTSLDHDLYLLSLAADQKGAKLSCEIDPDVPEYLWGDARRLVQVLTNLVHNGIRYSSGDVAIHVKNDGYDEQNRVILSFFIQDSGGGITIDRQKRIFNCFCHNNPCLAVSGDGAGIGLAICAQLVKLMGGDIGLASSTRGSAFWFTVPFRETAPPAIPEDGYFDDDIRLEKAKFALKGARLLLAEDEPINRVLTETLLSQAGVKVASVENGKRAVEEVESGDYQVVLMDLQMPQMDGLEATRQIRALDKDKGKNIVIIALTAQAMQGDREKCIQAGMDDYLTKPIEKGDLLNALTEWFTRKALVVDDDVESRLLLVQSLVENGWDVTMAETERSAMYEASLNRFDLILFDTNMAHVQGQEAVKVIRKLEEYSGRETTILGVGTGDEKERERCGKGGYDSILARPVTPETIKEMLQLIQS